jgi:hypothetical protein
MGPPRPAPRHDHCFYVGVSISLGSRTVQINSVARHLPALLGAGSSTGGSDGSQIPAGIAELGRDDDSAVERSAGFHQILADYDMQSITPRQFGELVQRLHDSGAIDDSELRQLARVRTELEQSGVKSDAPIDLVAFLERRENAAQSKFDLIRQDGSSDASQVDAAEIALEDTRVQLQWIRKFAVVHDAGSTGIDAGA